MPYVLKDWSNTENTVTVLPRGWKRDGSKMGIIAAVGYTDAVTGAAYDPARMQPMLYALADAGYPVVAADLGGAVGATGQFGSDTAIARVTSAKAYLQGAVVGAKSGKAALIGFSMGNNNLMAWAGANPASVACIAGFCPLSDLNDIVTNNRAGATASVNAAYGGAYSDSTNGPTHNPLKIAQAGSLAGIPTKLWYASDDAIVIPSTVTALATAIGNSASTVNAGTGGHSWNVQINNLTGLLAFLAANAT